MSSSLWRFVNTIQSTLDDAAGIDTVVRDVEVDDEFSDENKSEVNDECITNDDGNLVNDIDNSLEAFTEPYRFSDTCFSSSFPRPVVLSEVGSIDISTVDTASSTTLPAAKRMVNVVDTLGINREEESYNFSNIPVKSRIHQMEANVGLNKEYSDHDNADDTCDLNIASVTTEVKLEHYPSLISHDSIKESRIINHCQKCDANVTGRNVSNINQSDFFDVAADVAVEPGTSSKGHVERTSDELFTSTGSENAQTCHRDEYYRFENDKLIAQLTRLQQHLSSELQVRAALEEKCISLEKKFQGLLAKNKKMQEKLVDVHNKSRIEADARIQEVINDGIKLSKELVEEQQLLKRAVDRTHVLERDMDVAQREIDRLQSKEELWVKERKTLMNSEAELQSNLSQSISEIKKRDILIDDLYTQINDLKSVLESTKSEALIITSDMEALTKGQAEEHAIVIYNLHAEVDQLKHQLRRQAMDYDHRLASAEQEVTDANNRVIFAESRIMDAGQSVEDSTMELRNELQQSLQELGRMQELLSIRAKEKQEMERELSQKSSTIEEILKELDLNRRQWTNEKEGIMNIISAKDRTIMILREVEIEALRKKNISLKETISSMQKLLDERSINGSSSQPPHQLSLGEPSDKVATPVTALIEERSTSTFHTVSQELPLLSSDQYPNFGSNTQHMSSNRAQKELIRVSMELSALKSKYRDAQRSLEGLYKQHDILLQMYGEREEEWILATGGSDLSY